MEGKMFDLMTKLYSEFSEFRKETNDRFTGVEGGIKNLEKRMDKIEGHIIRMENEHGKKMDSLFDGYKQTFELEKENGRKIDSLAEKVTKQEVEIKVIKGGK